MTMSDIEDEVRSPRFRRKAIKAVETKRDWIMDALGQRARAVAALAQERALEQVSKRRDRAADTLETLADALRPHDSEAYAKARRRSFAVAGGSGLALTVALGVGVALGMMLSRQLKQRKEKALVSQPATATAPVAGAIADPSLDEPTESYDGEAHPTGGGSASGLNL